MSELSMSRATREAFLAEVHVGVFCVARPGHAPLASPVWYLYEPGSDVRVIVGRDSEKAELLRGAGVMSLCAQAEAMPYRFVTVEGPAVIEEGARDIAFEMAARYLGDELASGYVAATSDHDSVVVRLTPQRWRTQDYSGWKG